MPSAYHPSVGGVEVLTHRLAVNLTQAGHQVQVWTARSEGDDLAAREVVDGVDVRRFVFAAPSASVASLARWPAGAAGAMRNLLRAYADFRPDLLHVQCFSTNGAYATALSTARRVPLIVTLQGETVMDDLDIYEHSAFLRAALRLGLRRARVVTGCSQFTLDDSIRRFGLPPAKARVVFNGVDVDEAPHQAVELPFDRYVLGLGRVVPKKGFDLLLDAFAELAPRVPEVGLVIVGSGSALQGLKDQVARQRLGDRVHFPGKLGRGQVAAVMHGAAAFVMPSRVEPFGIVALEGWRAGAPVVVSSSGGAAEFVEHDRTGLVVDPNDRAALAEALERLLLEPELGKRLSVAAAERLPDFSWDRIRAEYERAYAEALAPPVPS
ncbi:glycosyltransferase family 4 protein [Motilibacter deserti]|uniref:Glycosyltransferase family 4 protein n=1 Tax=Motilibacter deserti TaxID=2714956 RepID=A0ABX0GU15_9ACTN|nr:glycosyltransferase family 4 protein [Motilibacter deserti]NHC14383.1 glycosyltransferase family 4 protein [Motilibacter deserti]